MEQETYTPGPWIINKAENDGEVYNIFSDNRDRDGAYIAAIWSDESAEGNNGADPGPAFVSDAEAECNARLIAQAPVMAALLAKVHAAIGADELLYGSDVDQEIDRMLTEIGTLPPFGERIRFVVVHDHDADLSYLAETEEEYDKIGPYFSPWCGVCGKRLTYKSGVPVHEGTGRIRCGGVPGFALATPVPLPFEEYQDTYGNHDLYESFGLVLEAWDPKPGHGWTAIESLWGIDYYTPADSTPATGEYETVEDLPDEYLREVGRDLLHEARLDSLVQEATQR